MIWVSLPTQIDAWSLNTYVDISLPQTKKNSIYFYSIAPSKKVCQI